MPADETVLVVDDNQMVRRFIEGVLRPLGLRVETAADGVEGLQRLAKGPVNLILLDFVMPRMNGYHFCRTLDEKRLAEGVPVVLLSSTDERVAEKMREHTRVVDFLPKPVKAGLLKQVVLRHLQAARTQSGSDEAQAADEEEEGSFEFDLMDDALDGPPVSESAQGPASSEPGDLLAELRDRLQDALASGLADCLDLLAACRGRDDLLGVIAETLAGVVDDALLQEFIERVRASQG